MKPRITIDVDEVERLAGQGLSLAEICLCLGISESTLYRRKAAVTEMTDAIKRGRSKAASEVANTLYTMAKGGDLGAIVWWEKTRRGLSDRIQQQVTATVYTVDIDGSDSTTDESSSPPQGD